MGQHGHRAAVCARVQACLTMAHSAMAEVQALWMPAAASRSSPLQAQLLSGLSLAGLNHWIRLTKLQLFEWLLSQPGADMAGGTQA